MKYLNKIKKGIFHPSILFYHLFSQLRVWRYRLNPNIYIGKNVIIEKDVVISTNGGGKIHIGDNSILYMKSFILTWGGNVITGDNFSLNAFSVIYGQGGLKIGNNVMIAGNTSIIPANHTFERIDIPMLEQPQIKKGVVVEDDVWIGSGVRILDGVTIGKGCIIGAGAVVTKSTEPYGIYLGIPAQKKKTRKH